VTTATDSGPAAANGKLNAFNGNFRQAEMVKTFLVSSEYRGRFAAVTRFGPSASTPYLSFRLTQAATAWGNLLGKSP
jgi:hypothetical protein